jgi:hypothetical protein
LLLAVERTPSQNEDPQASLTLPRAQYLSTEGVPASLVIHNTTSVELSYNALSVSFVIRGDDGKSYETRFVTVVTRPIPMNDYLFGGALRDSSASATQGLQSIRLKSTFAFVGETMASRSLTSPSGVEKLAYFGGATRFLGLSERAVLAADRPELYAVGVTTRQASDRLGLQPSAVATALAASRVRALAEQFGVESGAPNLLAAYPEVNYSADEVVVATGLASAPTGDLDRSWRALLPLNVTSPFAPIVTITTPAPGPRAPSPEALPATYLVPISVPGDPTLLAVRADVPGSGAAARFEPSASADCEALVLDAQKRSIEGALHAAIRRSLTSGKTLRHLLLAVAEPPYVDCEKGCRSTASDRAPALVHAPIELIFRTR